MTTFTDEDIRTLKERLRNNKYSVSYRAVVGLLERMEAAEACVGGLEEMYLQFKDAPHAQGLLVMGEAQDQLKAWRKAAGKDV